VENQWDLLEPLGIGPPDRADNPTEMIESSEARALVDARLAAAGIAPGEGPVVIHVSAGNPFRRWPAGAFVALAAGLARRRAHRVILTSGPSDAGAARRVRTEAQRAAGVEGAARIVDCGEFDLAELRALVGRASLFIGGDSGPLHIAGTTRVPIVGLFGPTLSARSAPWRDPSIPSEAVERDGLACRPCDQRRCVPGDFRCLAGIEAGEVLAAAERMLDRRPANAATKP